jgi:hypothetical protein
MYHYTCGSVIWFFTILAYVCLIILKLLIHISCVSSRSVGYFLVIEPSFHSCLRYMSSNGRMAENEAAMACFENYQSSPLKGLRKVARRDVLWWPRWPRYLDFGRIVESGAAIIRSTNVNHYTHLPTQWVPKSVSQKVERPKCDGGHSHSLSVEVKHHTDWMLNALEFMLCSPAQKPL